MRPHSLSLVPTLLAGLVLAGGCGGDDSSDDSGGGGGSSGGSGGTASGSKKDDGGGKKDKAAASSGAGQLKLTADPSGALKFDKTSLSTKAGKTTIVLDNPSSVPHAIEIEGKGVEEEGDTVEKGGVSKVTVDLKPGEYEYYCPVDGHKQAGMEGTLKVG
jgi:plastocyanin